MDYGRIYESTIEGVVQDATVITGTLLTHSDFVILPIGEFYAIFGMDWLTRHRAVIDCLKKKVKLGRHESVTFQGRGRGSKGSLITFQRAQ